MSREDDVRAVWGGPELAGLWEKAREALESPQQPATFRLELPDQATREQVGQVVGRPMWGQGTRISASKLDEALRNTRFGLGLREVLEILHGRPVEQRESAGAVGEARRERVIDALRDALAEHSLDSQPWAQPWIDWVRQYGRVADEALEQVGRRAAAVLAHLQLDPTKTPERWASRADLAARFGGGAHELDSGLTLTRVVLRAAALAHGAEPPGNERERRALWERSGVALDAVSATVLCWALPVRGESDWARVLRQRTALGLPTHLTQLDLGAAPEALVEPGTSVAVCENPRVLEAAVREDLQHPLVCVSGHPTTVALTLLRNLVGCGANLHYHGDFDWAGLAIARSVLAVGARPWRMSTTDYREAVNAASAQRVDLPTLVGAPTDSPWDPDLASLMADVGRAVEEEVVLPDLLTDLRTGL